MACLFTNCSQKGRNVEDKSTTDSAGGVANAKKEDSLLIQTQEVADWINKSFSSSGSKKFALEDFSSNDSLLVEEFEADSAFLKNYNSVLRWNADSTYILDIGSYGSVLLKDENGNYQVEAGEPDTEIALLDLRNKQRKRLLMAGPSSTIADGKWLNNNVLLVAGTFDKTGNGERDTLVWLIDGERRAFQPL